MFVTCFIEDFLFLEHTRNLVLPYNLPQIIFIPMEYFNLQPYWYCSHVYFQTGILYIRK